MAKTQTDTLRFDPKTHRLLSLRPLALPEQEFLASAPGHPTFVVQYLDTQRQYQQLTSLQATSVTARAETAGDAMLLTAVFTGLGGLDLDVTTQVRLSRSEPLSRWRITVRNRANLEVVDVQYPFVVCAYKLGGKPGTETLVLPHYYGQLMPTPSFERLGPDCPTAWHISATGHGRGNAPWNTTRCSAVSQATGMLLPPNTATGV